MADDSSPPHGAVHTRQDDAILHITIDRPKHRNTLSEPMIVSLVAALTGAATDDSLRAIHITGAGPDFCAGADLIGANAGAKARPRTGDLTRRIPHGANRVIELVRDIALPVVCSVRGWAVGLGCNLALAADFTVAAADAVFWEPFLTRGFSPDSGSTWLLPRLVGLAAARRMLLLGEKVGGDEAAAMGLIHQSAEPADLAAVADELVSRLAAGPTVAIGLAKRALNHPADTLAESLARELMDVELSCRTGDFKEGLAAFAERRAPRFQGR